MNTKFVHESRELTADELNTVSGGKGKEVDESLAKLAPSLPELVRG